MAVSDRELDEILDQLRHEKDADGDQPEQEKSADDEQPTQEPAPESDPVTPDAEPDAAQSTEESAPEPAPPNTPEQEQNTPKQEPDPEASEQKPTPEPLKPERSLVSVAIKRQQRRRAAGKQGAKTVPVRRQAADAEKRQRRIYDVPVLEETAQTAEQAEHSAKPQRRTLREAAVGLALLLFALIGLFALVRTGIRTASERSSTKNAAVTQCILPLCVMDMPSFEKPDDLTDQQFLTAAVWAFITDGRLAEYPSDTNLCTVPAAEIIKAGNLRFGTARQPECRTVGFTDALRFYYDADQDSFLLPADPRYFGNLPEVQSVTKQEGMYTVKAVCRPEQPAWYQTEAPVVRHSEFIMKQEHGTWQIVSLHTDAPDAQNEEETEPTHEQEDD